MVAKAKRPICGASGRTAARAAVTALRLGEAPMPARLPVSAPRAISITSDGSTATGCSPPRSKTCGRSSPTPSAYSTTRPASSAGRSRARSEPAWAPAIECCSESAERSSADWSRSSSSTGRATSPGRRSPVSITAAGGGAQGYRRPDARRVPPRLRRRRRGPERLAGRADRGTHRAPAREPDPAPAGPARRAGAAPEAGGGAAPGRAPPIARVHGTCPRSRRRKR
jgi:hypothetical protein